MAVEFRGGRLDDGRHEIQQRSTPELLRDMSRHAQRLFREELRLARAEMKEEMAGAARGGAVAGVGAALLYGGVLALIACVGFALALAMPLWLAFLITGVAFVLIGGLIAAGGAGRVKQTSLKPEETTQTLKEDGRWASETMRVVRSRTRANA